MTVQHLPIASCFLACLAFGLGCDISVDITDTSADGDGANGEDDGPAGEEAGASSETGGGAGTAGDDDPGATGGQTDDDQGGGSTDPSPDVGGGGSDGPTGGGLLCDPLLQDCPDGQACYGVDDTFECVSLTGDSPQQIGDACVVVEDCDYGLQCVDGFCVQFCEVGGAACDGLDYACVPYFPEGTSPPGLESVGLCTLA